MEMKPTAIPKIGPHRLARDYAEPYEEVSLHIQQWMQLLEVNQVQLQKLTETSGSGTISKRLANPHSIDVEWINKIARALNIHPLMLFQDPRKVVKAVDSAALDAARAAVRAQLTPKPSKGRSK